MEPWQALRLTLPIFSRQICPLTIDRNSDSFRYPDRIGDDGNVSFSTQVPTYFMGIIGYKNITISGTSTSTFTMPTYINFYLMLDVSGSMSFPSTTAEQERLMAVNPDNLNGTDGYPGGCQFACHFTAQGACSQTGNPGQGPIPAAGKSTNPGSGGYCQGFIISRLGTTPVVFCKRHDQHNQRKQCKLEQYAGYNLLYCRNDLLHPIARRCRWLCRQ
jgi:hypothetical protein